MEDLTKVLEELGIKYNATEEEIKFNYCDIDIKYNLKDDKIYVDKEYFAKVPHVMRDGSICFYGNSLIGLEKYTKLRKFKNIVSTYIPWLFSVEPQYKVLEMLGEIDFYARAYLKIETCSSFVANKNNVKNIIVSNPLELWEAINGFDFNKTYFISPLDMSNYGVYLTKKDKNTLLYDYDDCKKASQRVLGLNYKDESGKYCFIGVGSINSYMIKICLERGLKYLVVIDDDKFETGNIFRFAFPFKYKSKIECVSKYCKILDESIMVKGHLIKITPEIKQNYLIDCNKVFVSVDNFGSWIDCYDYVKEHMANGIEVIFAGVNAFGGYGKFIKCNSKEKIEDCFWEFLLDELLEKDKERPRSMMVPNGCGKSLAIYDERSILKLTKNVIESNEFEKVIYVEFD